jgi:DNA-binding protein HU-beta
LICPSKTCVWRRETLAAKPAPQTSGQAQGITMNKPMTKTQLVAAIADAMGGDKKTAGAALDAIAAVVSREVAAGGTVTIPGLGKVACKARPERQVRNPATGETMTKPADKQVKFAIAKSLKDVVNG